MARSPSVNYVAAQPGYYYYLAYSIASNNAFGGGQNVNEQYGIKISGKNVLVIDPLRQALCELGLRTHT
jgi:hypothetical protein